MNCFFFCFLLVLQHIFCVSKSKFYAWELSFTSLIEKIRQSELRILSKILYLKTLSEFLMNTSPFIVSLLSFGTFILLNDNDKVNGEQLTAEKTFVTIALFNALRHPLYNLPNTISNCIQVRIILILA
jgi:ATP-binding cassette subfamily C (CFTR/MRP) protein 1